MPKGTRVHRCVEKVKRKGGNVNPYAVCQSATGQSYATGRTMKKAKYNTKLMSPKGDVGKYNEGELHRAFPKKIKGGKEWSASKAIPWRGTDAMEGDKGSGVRENVKDKVV